MLENALERALVKEVILFQFALKDRVVLSAHISWWSCSNAKAYHSQIGEKRTED